MDQTNLLRRSSVAMSFLEDLAKKCDEVDVTMSGGTAVDLERGFSAAIDLMTRSCRGGRKLIFVGNGGSAAIASHQAIDYWKNGGLEALAFNDASLLTCIGNDFGYDKVFAEPIKRFARDGDVLLAISSSGRSPNILNAVTAARGVGCHVMTLSGFDTNNPLRELGDLNFYVPSHSYGVVEISHLMLLHGMLEEIIQAKTTLQS